MASRGSPSMIWTAPLESLRLEIWVPEKQNRVPQQNRSTLNSGFWIYSHKSINSNNPIFIPNWRMLGQVLHLNQKWKISPRHCNFIGAFNSSDTFQLTFLIGLRDVWNPIWNPQPFLVTYRFCSHVRCVFYHSWGNFNIANRSRIGSLWTASILSRKLLVPWGHAKMLATNCRGPGRLWPQTAMDPLDLRDKTTQVALVN